MTNKYILTPLLLIMIIAFSVQFFNMTDITVNPYDGTYGSGTGINGTDEYDGGDQIDFLGLGSVDFTTALMTGLIALFIVIIVIGIVSGLNISVLGSTVQISERSQKLLFVGLLYGGLWGMFSVLATIGVSGIGLFSIPLYFGVIFYFILTMIFIIGLAKEIDG